VRLTLEVTGRFTGPAGKQVINLDLARLPRSEAEELRHEVELVPETAWGASFLAPHPKPWDFHHLLRVEDNGREKWVAFHLNEGPSVLTRLSEKLIKLDPSV